MMRRVVVIAVAGLALGGCSSLSLDAFKPAPIAVNLQLDSVPPGADAVTSLGPSCKTPCTVAVVPAGESFAVTFNMNKFQPVTVPIQVTNIPGDFGSPPVISLDPNPVVAELPPAVPLRRSPPRKRNPPPARAAAPAAGGSPFPTPR
jgi:hypothetical protein